MRLRCLGYIVIADLLRQRGCSDENCADEHDVSNATAQDHLLSRPEIAPAYNARVSTLCRKKVAMKWPSRVRVAAVHRRPFSAVSPRGLSPACGGWFDPIPAIR